MDNIKRFDIAVQSLSQRLSAVFMLLGNEEKEKIREIRLRTQKPVIVITGNETKFVSKSGRLTEVFSELNLKTDENEINEIFRRMCGYSVHSFTDAINQGYVTLAGGHRAGVAGTAVSDNGKITAVRDICCINLRIAREIKGAADDIYKLFFMNDISSVIIAGPPSSGKTTILRDLARQLSGFERGRLIKTFICDERGEIGACVSGISQNDLGINSDLLSCYPKEQGILIGLRSFSPDIIICDEIATDAEASAVESGLNSGVSFALSVHAKDEKDLRVKPIVRRLLKSGSFQHVILLSSKDIGKTEKVFKAGELVD
ncbi:MAG: stage III sporulation protein AA [Clostridia bacterium]|nr:stage III sporulation protein AA [Clostridia bacterium]